MNKKLLILSAILTSSLAIAPLQANWQEWIPSKKAVLIGLTLTGTALTKYLFYRKAMEMVNTAEDEFAQTPYENREKFLHTDVTLQAHGSTEDFHNNYSFYLTNQDKSIFHKILNLFVSSSFKIMPRVRSKANNY